MFSSYSNDSLFWTNYNNILRLTVSDVNKANALKLSQIEINQLSSSITQRITSQEFLKLHQNAKLRISSPLPYRGATEAVITPPDFKFYLGKLTNKKFPHMV